MPNIITDILNVIYPPLCHMCGRPLVESEQFICSKCQSELPRCRYVADAHNPMNDALAAVRRASRCGAFLAYTPHSPLGKVIHDFKYRGYSRLARHMGRLAAKEMQQRGFFIGVDMLMPVPLHISKRLRRGYNQSELICKGISDVTGLPVCTLLKAHRPHRTQTHLSHQQRRQNLEGVFTLRHPERLHGLTVLIVDDVFTTGATLLAAAEETERATGGHTDIRAFSLASASTL